MMISAQGVRTLLHQTFGILVCRNITGFLYFVILHNQLARLFTFKETVTNTVVIVQTPIKVKTINFLVYLNETVHIFYDHK